MASQVTKRPLLGLLGLVSWIQGFRCFPWMAVNFFLKDGLNVAPSTLQILQNSANLPMVGKPLYGVVSDAVYISGEHRLPYIAIGALLQAVSWLMIVLLPASLITIPTLSFFLLLGNLGASIGEVANDAIVAEASTSSGSSGQLQSFVWISASIAGVFGNLFGGIAVDALSPKTMFFIYGIFLIIQFFVTVFVREKDLNLPLQSPSKIGIGSQLSELLMVLQKPEIKNSIVWFSASYAVIPILTGTMFFYQTQHLKLDSSVLGLSKVFGQAAMLLWSIAYNRWFKMVPARKLISVIQGTIAVFMVSDALFIKGFYRNLGISDSVYVVVFSGMLEVLFLFKVLPFSVLIARLCPLGCEGSLMAFLMSALAFSTIISGYLGVALASLMGVSANDFSGLPLGILIQATCTLVPLFWSSWIPHEADVKKQRKAE
ncbi:putative folate-biopterin transporter 7 [Acorus gramineus]|uniref:Folate-biopterin transporter 7 n=1 Tax=Acorus gramineus TaxID=55184 RepID=A0AAV9BBJ9_ACOGR|nr:putative folate-biopterin transporter 7 [Acorus gramineus]